MEDIKAADQQAYQWLLERDFEKWTLVFDAGARYGTMTTNASESFNGVLKKVRGLPIQALVSSTYFHCIGLFIKRREDASKWDSEGISKFVPKIKDMIGINENGARSLMRPSQINSYEFMCYDDHGRSQKVIMGDGEGTCTCQNMLIYHLPCSHMISTLSMLRIRYVDYVYEYYTITSYMGTYGTDFHGIPDITSWLPLDEARGIIELFPPIMIHRKGRSKTQRFRNTMDENQNRTNRRCGVCKTFGHNRSSCSQNPENRR
ncbi:hypothetical protein KSP39_PZI002341 [Platanthera zijinensis]|uniref:SWIM-type domain-containing protein n=1 Tax=Platanthera zijinensis TaxID=2320716 RepID=A0AAP0GEH4_9ASPA